MSDLPFISIVCLTWNSREDILKLLKSIDTSYYPREKYEVIVVDNASTDGSVEQIKKRFPKTNVIALSKNIGMPAFNVGYRKARGKFIFSIQSDVIVAKHLFSRAVEKLQSDPKIHLLGVKVFDKKTKRFLSPCIKFNFYTGVISPIQAKEETSDFDYLEGLTHIFPRTLLKKVGFIDKTYFFYGDDPDFCFRIKKVGLKMVYFPNTYVLHGKSKSTPRYFKKKYHNYYKAVFQIVYTYGNILQKISVTFSQLLIVPFYVLAKYKRNSFGERLWGLWWNIKNSHFYTKIFVASLAIGILLRIYALYTRDFWFDEAFTYHVSKLPINQLLETVLTDNNPPLYYTIIHYILKVNHNELLIRLPSLVFNIATLYFLFKFLNEYINRKTAIIATLLFSLSPLSVYLSSTARLHSLTTFLVIIQIWLFFKLIKNQNLKNVVLFVLFAILGVYSQYYFALLFIPFTWIVIQKKTKLSFRYWTIMLLTIVSIFSPWLFLSIQTIHNGCSCPNTYLSLPGTLASPILGGVGEVTLRSFPNLPFYYIIFFVFAMLFYFIFFLRGLGKYKNLTLLYIIPLSILAFSGLFMPVFSPKGFAIFSPIFFAIIALGLLSFQPPKRSLTFIPFTLIGIISLIQFMDPFFSGLPFKRMLPIIKTHENASIAHTSLISYYSMQYYTQDKHINILLTKNLFSDATVKNIGGHMQEIDKKTDRFWLIDTDKWVDQKEREAVLKNISEDFTKIEYYRFGLVSLSYLVQSKTLK